MEANFPCEIKLPQFEQRQQIVARAGLVLAQARAVAQHLEQWEGSGLLVAPAYPAPGMRNRQKRPRPSAIPRGHTTALNR